MIKSFRNIRQNMIGERNVKQYLLYVIGEILLVMLGILLALQVNNLNQNRIEKNKEQKALTDLFKEFKLNKDRIQAKQSSRVSITPKLKHYVKLITAGDANYKAFKTFHKDPFMFGMTNPSNGVIDALISSGEIALLSNDELKYLIADWKNQIENLYENEQILWNSGLAYIGSYSKIIPDPSRTWSNWNATELQTAFEQLNTNVEYKNNLVGFEGVNSIVIEECNTVLHLLNTILDLLEAEIKQD